MVTDYSEGQLRYPTDNVGLDDNIAMTGSNDSKNYLHGIIQKFDHLKIYNNMPFEIHSP